MTVKISAVIENPKLKRRTNCAVGKWRGGSAGMEKIWIF